MGSRLCAWCEGKTSLSCFISLMHHILVKMVTLWASFGLGSQSTIKGSIPTKVKVAKDKERVPRPRGASELLPPRGGVGQNIRYSLQFLSTYPFASFLPFIPEFKQQNIVCPSFCPELSLILLIENVPYPYYRNGTSKRIVWCGQTQRKDRKDYYTHGSEIFFAVKGGFLYHSSIEGYGNK